MRAGSVVVTTSAVIALLGFADCQQQPPQPTAVTKGDEGKATKGEGKQVTAPAQPGANAQPAASGESQPSEAPPWFSADIIEHEKVIQQGSGEQKLAGVYVSAIVLQLKPGTTPADCMSTIEAKLGESVRDLPEPTPGPNGRLTLHGDAGPYQYTIVCGSGKDGQPTMYMSYSLE